MVCEHHITYIQSVQRVIILVMRWSTTAETSYHHFSFGTVSKPLRLAGSKNLHVTQLRTSQRISIRLKFSEKSFQCPESQQWWQFYRGMHYHPLKPKKGQLLQQTISQWSLGLHLDTVLLSQNLTSWCVGWCDIPMKSLPLS